LGFGWCFIYFSWFLNLDRPPPLASNTAATLVFASPTTVSRSTSKEPASHLTEAAQAIEQVEQRLKDNKESLKKYYSTPEAVRQAGLDIVVLAMAKVTYGENGKTKEEKALGQKAIALLAKVGQQARVMYASSVEEVFVKNGMEVVVSAIGKEKKKLRIVYVLMSQPLVYKFQNEIKVGDQAVVFGFTKLLYTNGLESSLGQTWTVEL